MYAGPFYGDICELGVVARSKRPKKSKGNPSASAGQASGLGPA